MSAEEMPLTPATPSPEQDADTRPVAVTLASVTRDGRRAILVDEQGREFTLELDPRLQPAPTASSAQPSTSPQQPRRRTEVPMESTLRPRDIQARIRAGESPEEVAEAARSTVEKIMPFAAPVLAEREHTAERAQKASVRRKPGEASAVRTLGDAVAAHLRGFELEPDAIAWDSFRRHDGRWKLLGYYDLPGRSGTAELTFDIPGNYVSIDNDDARWLIGERLEAPAPPAVPNDLEAARLRRLQPVDGAAEIAAPASVPAEAPAEHEVEAVEAEVTEPVSATEPTIETPLLEAPLEAYLFDTPATRSSEPEKSESRAEAPAAEAQQAPEAEPEAPVRRTKRKGRASVPSWDEIMFGGGPSK